MNYAARILSELDERLSDVVDFTLYGRAAFQLGFEDPPKECSQSLDVDVVLWLGQAEQLQRTTNFWEALEETNQVLAPSGLYMSHLFEEDQVILSPDWRNHRNQIPSQWLNLDLHRLGDEDLLLSKLMRDDPQDRSDALFIVRQRGWDVSDLSRIVAKARVPPIDELKEQFSIATSKLRSAMSSQA